MKERLKDLLRPFVHGFRKIRDRTLHPLRRRRARVLVRDAVPLDSILFICTGNICRSAYAEKVFAGQSGSGTLPELEVLSAGFLKSDRPSPESAVRVAEGRGVELHSHRSRRVEAEFLERSNLVVIMDRSHEKGIRALSVGDSRPLLYLGDLDPEVPDSRDIPDPWGESDDVFERTFDRIDRCLGELSTIVVSCQRP